MKQIFPIHTVEVLDLQSEKYPISYTFRSMIYVYGDIQENNKRSVYTIRLAKEYRTDIKSEENFKHFELDFLKFGIQAIRFSIPMQHAVDPKGNKLFTYIGDYTDQEIILKDLI